jgi:hypothetical protein
MLQKPPPSPSTGALRLLRWLALYGSFGTAAGATAFVLEEQRRQICRLSRIRDNGKKLREFMHRRNHTNAPSLPDFHDYVQDLETKGLVKREPVIQSGKAGIAGVGSQENYHYEMKPKSRPSGDSTGEKHIVNPSPVAGGVRRTFTNSSRKLGRLPPFRRLESMPHPESCPPSLRIDITKKSKPSSGTRSRQASQRKTARREVQKAFEVLIACGDVDGDPGDLQDFLSAEARAEDFDTLSRLQDAWKRSRQAAQEKTATREVREAFEALIARRDADIDPGDLQDFLSTAARAEDFDTISRLLDACEAELPWSDHLYPSVLHSLVVAALPSSPSLSRANNILALGQRVLYNVSIDLEHTLESFYQASIFPLVLFAYQKSPDHPWGPDRMAMILESALQINALGIDCTLLLTDIFRRFSKDDGHILRTFPQLSRKVDIPSGSRSRFYLTVLQCFGQGCGRLNSPGILDTLNIVLKRCVNLRTSPAAFTDVVFNIINGNESCCEE